MELPKNPREARRSGDESPCEGGAHAFHSVSFTKQKPISQILILEQPSTTGTSKAAAVSESVSKVGDPQIGVEHPQVGVASFRPCFPKGRYPPESRRAENPEPSGEQPSVLPAAVHLRQAAADLLQPPPQRVAAQDAEPTRRSSKGDAGRRMSTRALRATAA